MAGNKITLNFAGDTDKLEKAFDRVNQSSKKMEDNVQRLNVKSIALGSAIGSLASKAVGLGVDLLRTGLEKAIDLFNSSIDAASNLNESMNAVSVVFKQNSKEIEDWYESNKKSLGLSKRAFNELITPLGALLKNAGLNMRQVSDNTKALTQRAADMASVFNTDVSDALEAIQAGLRGEMDPLERYGVHLSAAAVQAEALAETHKKAASTLTDVELATARVNLIMKQTTDAAGDFKNTANGLANSSRNLAAETENVQATIGQKLLPVMLAWNRAKLTAVETISTRVLPMLSQLDDWFRTKIYPTIKDVMVPALKDLHDWFQENVAPAIKYTVDKAAELKNQFDEVAKSSKGLQKNLEDLWARIGPLQGAFKFLGVVMVSSIAAGLVMIQSVVVQVSFLIGLINKLIDKLGGARKAAYLLGGPITGYLFGLSGRAEGGPVKAGQPYMVGEKGKPEVFVPSENGVIVPDVAKLQASNGSPIASGGSQTITLKFTGERGLVELIKELVTVHGGGDVQAAFGS